MMVCLCVCEGYVKYTVWRHISNIHENMATHCASYTQETTSNLLWGACIFIHTHTKYHLYVHTIICKYYPHKHTHIHTCTHKELYTILIFFRLYFSFSSISFILCLMIVVYKTAWKLRSKTCFHAIRYK